MSAVLMSLTSRLRRTIALAACVGLLAGLAAAPALGQSSIKILVNDQPITTYDIQQRTRMVRAFTSGRQGEQQAIEQLINEKLMLQEAARLRVQVSDEELEAEFASRASDANLSASQFQQAMRQAGFDPQTFRDFLRANIAWSQIVRSRFRATVNITEQDVAAALTGRETDPEQQQTATEYLLQQIIFVMPENAGSGTQAQRQRDAAAFRSAFQGCDQSLQQASSMQGVVVKPPVRREEGQLGAQLKAKLEALEVGGVTTPERTDEGIEIVAVCGKDEIAGQTEAALEARQELSSKRGQLLARRYLRDLRSDAAIEYR